MMKNNLREYRKARKITQEQLAQKVNVSRRTIIAIEKGNYNPSLLLALRICKELDCHVENVFMLEDKEAQ
ncbi:helix-turn-helix transcriptional regulator [Thermoactinomyces mirandus]|uniref:Helix-turn-helix transcriptional regulator n=1 Tax=Thermoactinomyces mirandus TaxID=2756294 RepID=A0A7W1XUH9_9BACL|nr:helix-turn-helix transcriptional regulator [Thermoactinomyces mirandus]MBA4603302.1 helix-turn-helix transcriptional regulator [Thermoactinomyces mirandus]